ncbi:MAG: hypothetical protein GXY07_03585 [Candidatus Hydrogenedentes bacterium]|nr:hypothetical protein [Candidatus Hydrogenedentota bacterium]
MLIVSGEIRSAGTSNACFHAPFLRPLCAALLLCVAAVADPLPEMLRFMDCTLPLEQYIVTHAQRRDGDGAPWQAVIPDTQCFRTWVVPEYKVVLWRKDALNADYYGEIFTYDDTLVRLHMETFPPRTPVDGPDSLVWDPRPDRFRLFVEAGEREDWRLGRVFAPLEASTAWRHSGCINTYICNTWNGYHDRTAPRWQERFLDNAVFLERQASFSTFFDGPCPDGYAPDTAFTAFDEAIVINQCMQQDAGRERFFFARKGEDCYGIVRWDNAVKRDGTWVVLERTIGLRLGVQEPEFSFAGMLDRVRKAR